MSNEEIIELIRNGGHEKALDVLYTNYPAFKNSFKKSGGKADDAEDIFQDALVIFIEKVTNQSFNLTCNFKSYLFSICRNLSYEYFRKKGKEKVIQNDREEEYLSADVIQDFLEREIKYAALDKTLKSIGDKCLTLLNLYYFNNQSMKSITQKMGFKNENSAKNQKYKCIERARKLSKDILVDLKTQMS